MKITTFCLLLCVATPTFAENNSAANSDSSSDAQSSIYIGGSESINNTPSMSSGSNNTVSCAVSRSAAIAVPGFGASVGNGKIDEDCNTREEALVLRNLVGAPAAIEHLCRNDDSLRETLVAQGYCRVVSARTVVKKLYSMCKRGPDGKIYISVPADVDRYVATKQCKQALGF